RFLVGTIYFDVSLNSIFFRFLRRVGEILKDRDLYAVDFPGRAPAYIDLLEPAPSVLVFQLVYREYLTALGIGDGKEFGDRIVIFLKLTLVKQADGVRVGKDTILHDGIAKDITKFLCYHDDLAPKLPDGFI